MTLLTDVRAFIARRGFWIQGMVTPKEAWTVIERAWPKLTEHALVRVGGDGDGGYLIPESQIDKVKAVFSPGVSDVSNFELFFANRGIRCHLADGSVDQAPSIHQNFFFTKKMIGAMTSEPMETISLRDWIEDSKENSADLLLQMDIEGSEYESLLAAERELLGRFRVIVIELHDLHAIVTKAGLRLISLTLSKLLEQHVSVHLHVNNASDRLRLGQYSFPDTLELTFLRKDLVADTKGGNAELPHPLDQKNTPKPDWHMSLPADG